MINCIHSLTMHSHKIFHQVNIYKRQLLFSHSVMSGIAMSWTAPRQASLSFTISQSFLRLKSLESMMPSKHLIFSHQLLILPSIFPSIRVISKELVICIRWPKYWSFSIRPCKEYSGLISFRIGWFNLLAAF